MWEGKKWEGFIEGIPRIPKKWEGKTEKTATGKGDTDQGGIT